MPFSRVTTLERDGTRLEGERGALVAAIAQARGRIAETQLKILQIDEDLRTEVGKELAEIRGEEVRTGREAGGGARTSSSASTWWRRRTERSSSAPSTRWAA